MGVRGWGVGVILPLQKGGTGKVLAILKGGTTSFGVVLTWVLVVLSITGGGHKSYVSTILKGGGHKQFYPVLSGGGRVSYPRFSHFVASPSP